MLPRLCDRGAMAPVVHAMSITPFDAGGAVDDALLRAHLRYLGAGGVGVYVASQGSGEGDLLSAPERCAVYRIAADELRDSVPVVAAGIGLAGSTAAIRALAVDAAAAGVDAVQVLGPRLGAMRPRADELDAYFRSVIEAVDCDVHLSSNTVLTGYELPVGLVEQLLDEYPRVRVLNVSDPRPESLHAFVRQFAPRVEVRVGMTAELAAAREAGARGFLSFEANVAPRLVCDAVAHESYDELLRLNAALARGGNPRSLKAALRILGRDGGELRALFLPLTAEQHAGLRRDLDGLVQKP